MRGKTQFCPMCQQTLTIKNWSADRGKTPLSCTYCEHCGYGLQEAFYFRINTLHWGDEEFCR